MLSPYRVLDLTDNRAALGPMMLADLGADVVKVEPPGGSADRHGDGELSFLAYNRNKRGVTLDLDDAEGRSTFLRLVESAHFLFENAPPGAMAARGLGYDDLRAVNPSLVYVAVTPFGQTGPYADFLATDLTLAAMGGMVAINGDADRPPLRVSVPQCWLHAAAESAPAAMIAHARRLQTGEAQFVDVSVQAAVFWTTLNASIAAAIQGKPIERAGTALQLGSMTVKVMFGCADGDVVATVNGALLRKLVPMMVEDGVVPEFWLTGEEWGTYDVRLLTGQPLAIDWQTVQDRIAAFTALHTRETLFRSGMAAGVFLAPVNTVADVMVFDHLDTREYWQPLTAPSGETLRAPGPWVRFARTPIRYRHPPPAVGEHNDELRVPSSKFKVQS